MADEQRPARLTRRQLIVAVAAAGVAGGAGIEVSRRVLLGEEEPLGAPTREPTPSPEASRTADPTPAPTATPDPTPEPPEDPTEEPTEEPPALEPAPPYEPVAGEIRVEAKAVAAAFAQALTSYGPDDDPEGVLDAALADRSSTLDRALVSQEAQRLHVPAAASTGRVVYPQLGGLAPAEDPVSASVMVVLEQRLLDDAGEERSVTRTLDVRVVVEGGRWLVDGLPSAGGEELARPDGLSDLAVAVLDDERIDLPDSARWDIHEGIVDDRLLEQMLVIADEHPYGVTCLRNGHPVNVFGTDRTSNHTLGRGVDIWRIGDDAIVSQQPDRATPAHEVNAELFEGGTVQELGGPWAFDGFGGRSFTNEVHLDHLHVAFY